MLMVVFWPSLTVKGVFSQVTTGPSGSGLSKPTTHDATELLPPSVTEVGAFE